MEDNGLSAGAALRFTASVANAQVWHVGVLAYCGRHTCRPPFACLPIRRLCSTFAEHHEVVVDHSGTIHAKCWMPFSRTAADVLSSRVINGIE